MLSRVALFKKSPLPSPKALKFRSKPARGISPVLHTPKIEKETTPTLLGARSWPICHFFIVYFIMPVNIFHPFLYYLSPPVPERKRDPSCSPGQTLSCRLPAMISRPPPPEFLPTRTCVCWRRVGQGRPVGRLPPRVLAAVPRSLLTPFGAPLLQGRTCARGFMFHFRHFFLNGKPLARAILRPK